MKSANFPVSRIPGAFRTEHIYDMAMLLPGRLPDLQMTWQPFARNHPVEDRRPTLPGSALRGRVRPIHSNESCVLCQVDCVHPVSPADAHDGHSLIT